MTPYERLVIAMRHGVLVKGKAMTKFAADIHHQSARCGEADPFSVFPLEAAHPMEAARRAAEVAATRRYEKKGCVGFLTAADREGWYRASIGQQEQSHDGIALRGVTISIHVWPMD